jgi:aminopeptidase-like protein
MESSLEDRPGVSSELGLAMYELIRELYPICRSITGDGVRQSLQVLTRHIPLDLYEVPTGTPVFDWTVPKEWNIADAYIKDVAGRRLVDFRAHNLHVLNYSIPIHTRLPLAALRAHLFTLPEHPDWIPYRTSYYTENWGFCLSHRQLQELADGDYEVCIESSLEEGALTYGEYYLPGDLSDEVLISCHICHPSLCNDNLSGVALATCLAQSFGSQRHRYSYRFLFIPGTIGSITWLARNEQRVRQIVHGLVLAGVGDDGPFTYKRSRRGDAEIDRAFAHVFAHLERPTRLLDFSPYGYDERQYCSPGFNLPVGCFMRTPYGEYPQYHTSADNLDLVSPASLGASFDVANAVLRLLEDNRTYVNTNPKGEPQLGRRGLYRSVAGQADTRKTELAMFWVLNLSDGHHTLLDIADRARMPFDRIRAAADVLWTHGLLRDFSAPDLGRSCGGASD